jgi:hypothetical protein
MGASRVRKRTPGAFARPERDGARWGSGIFQQKNIRDREYLIDVERSEEIYLVTRDHTLNQPRLLVHKDRDDVGTFIFIAKALI